MDLNWVGVLQELILINVEIVGQMMIVEVAQIVGLKKTQLVPI